MSCGDPGVLIHLQPMSGDRAGIVDRPAAGWGHGPSSLASRAMQAPSSRGRRCPGVYVGRGRAPLLCPGPVWLRSGGRRRLALVPNLQLGLPWGHGHGYQATGMGAVACCVPGPCLRLDHCSRRGLWMVLCPLCSLEPTPGLVGPPGPPGAGLDSFQSSRTWAPGAESPSRQALPGLPACP